MILHAHIDLSKADLAIFEAYENAVIPLLDRYGITMVVRLRAKDGASEVHVLDTPDMATMQRFRDDPERAAVQHMWDDSGATGVVTQMRRVG